MSAEVFSEYLEKRGKKTSLFYVKNTSLGIFSLRNIEARVSKKLEPMEKFTLGIALELGVFSRIELHVLSGHSIEVCEETIRQLEYHDLIELIEFNREMLNANIDRISKSLGVSWQTPPIQRILKRKYLKMYSLTKSGEKALKNSKKDILDSVDLDLLITSKPLHLVYEKGLPKSQGFESIDMTPDMVYTLLSFALEYSDDTGVEPISLTPSTIASGAEIVTSNLWIGLGKTNGKKDLIKYYPFISSNALERWISLDISEKLIQHIPKFNEPSQIVSNAISYTFDMVMDIILDGLKVENTNLWKLTCDLEMLMLISHVDVAPIRQIRPEIRLKLNESEWDVIIKIELEPEDELAFSGLAAARFHANVHRGGFRLSQGYELWEKIFEEWGRKTSYNEYKETIEVLVENECLREILPEINGIIIDVNSVLRMNKRGSQNLEFNRLRQIDALLEEAGIDDRLYIATENIESKIDEFDSFEEWVENGTIEITDIDDEIHPAFSAALEKNYYYLGNRKKPTGDEFKEMRRNMHFIGFNLDNKKVVIPKLEPFYEFNNEKILDRLYDHYYE